MTPAVVKMRVTLLPMTAPVPVIAVAKPLLPVGPSVPSNVNSPWVCVNWIESVRVTLPMV